jgi:TonB family protein
MRWTHYFTLAMLAWAIHPSLGLAEGASTGRIQDAVGEDAGGIIEKWDPDARAMFHSQYGRASDPVLLSPVELRTCIESAAGSIRGNEKPTVVRLMIGSTGVPLEVAILTSSGSRQLDSSLLTCYRAARYQPGQVDGKPSSLEEEVQIKWVGNLPAKTCEASMRIWQIVRVEMTTPSEVLPSTAEATLCSCGSEDGKRAEPVIINSSGTERVDEGILKLMKQSARSWTGPAGCRAYKFEVTRRTKVPNTETSQPSN